MKEADQARRDGTSAGDDSGIVTRVANMAVEDPNKLKQMGQAGANMAASNPGMASAALGMAAAGGPVQGPEAGPGFGVVQTDYRGGVSRTTARPRGRANPA